MATAKWIPGRPQRSRFEKANEQAAKAAKVTKISVAVFATLIAAIAFSGCKSSGRSGLGNDSALGVSDAELANYIRPGGEVSGAGNLANQTPDIAASIENPVRSQPQVQLAAFQSDELEEVTDSRELQLEQVIQSVAECYPAVEVAIAEIESANGKVLSSWGQFDTIFAANSISQPVGFYETYRNAAQINRPLYGGGEVYGAYRIGDGQFEPWYGERETNEGGEFKAGFSLPFLKDRNIDARRAALLTAGANRDEVEANVESRLLQFQRFASQAYWDWVASGRAVRVQEHLLELAQQRVKQIDKRVEKGDLARIAQIDNDRFIAKRKNDLIKARRALEKAAIKMSLFYRDATCTPVVAPSELLPEEFPSSTRIADVQLTADTATAVSIRPELQELNAARRAAGVDLDYANNLTMPKLDMKGFAGQDVGPRASKKADKSPFELQVGFYAEVPLQRREGLGKIRTAQGKLAQIEAKTRLLTDKIRVELQDAASAVNAAFDQIEQSQKTLDLNLQSLELGRLSFEAGDIDLISLNIYETSVANAQLQLLDARFKYFYYLAAYEAAKSGTAFEIQ